MKFDCGPSLDERIEARRARIKEWHRWFAWRPVRVGQNECVWLETVERKGTYWVSWYEGGWEWRYRRC